MLFNSLEFAVFLPIVFALFWLLPEKFRWIVILVSSYYFYMSWNVKYVVLILFTTVISYFCARILQNTDKERIKKISLVVTLVASLGVLFVYKYFNFFIDSFAELMNTIGFSVNAVTLSLLLPVGISFYTFQTLSYVIDVYRGDAEVEKNFGKYAAFVAFFPQLVAGPIERTKNLLPQISRKHTFKYENAAYGLRIMAWGFFKKIVIADTLAMYVDQVYNELEYHSGFSLVLAMIMFTFQIYCDFSGYSDIAIGTAKLFDIELMKNFSSPYFSASIKEFWSRWHISLSTWFKDYVYIPLGGNRCSKPRHYLNLILTFGISGLWHGASWTYVVWGLIHGVGQVLENIFSKGKKITRSLSKKSTVFTWISVVGVFIFCIITWVFFRAESFGDAIYIFKNAFKGISIPGMYIMDGLKALSLGSAKAIDLVIMLALLLVFDFFNIKHDVIAKIGELKAAYRWIIYIIFTVVLLYLLPQNAGNEFIYFQF